MVAKISAGVEFGRGCFGFWAADQIGDKNIKRPSVKSFDLLIYPLRRFKLDTDLEIIIAKVTINAL